MLKRKIVDRKLYTVLEYIYLVIMGIELLYYFFLNTMFEIQWSEYGLFHIRTALIAIVIIRLAISEKVKLEEALLMLLVGIVFYEAYVHSSTPKELIDVPLLMLGAYNIPVKKIAKTYFIILLSSLLYTVKCAKAGEIANLAYKMNQGRRIRYSLGTTHYFYVTAITFYLICAYIMIRSVHISFIELAIIEAINLYVYSLCKGRNHLICITLLVVLCTIYKILDILYPILFKKKFCVPKLIGVVSCFTPILCGTTTVILCMNYSEEVSWMKKVNALFSGRFRFGKAGYENIGLSVWGQIVKMYGTSARGTQSATEHNGFMVDSTFIFMALRYGIIFLTVILALLFYMNVKAYREENWILLIVLTVNVIQFIIDRDIFYIHCDFLIWCAFASYHRSEKSEVRIKMKKKVLPPKAGVKQEKVELPSSYETEDVLIEEQREVSTQPVKRRRRVASQKEIGKR